jgi:hypothetical protein
MSQGRNVLDEALVAQVGVEGAFLSELLKSDALNH